MNRVKTLLAAGITAIASIAISPAAQATGQNSCAVGDKCVSDYHAGSVYYGFDANVPNFGAYQFSNGHNVNNDLGHARVRDTYWDTMCLYEQANYSWWTETVTSSSWTLVQRDGSSYAAHTSRDYC